VAERWRRREDDDSADRHQTDLHHAEKSALRGCAALINDGERSYSTRSDDCRDRQADPHVGIEVINVITTR